MGRPLWLALTVLLTACANTQPAVQPPTPMITQDGTYQVGTPDVPVGTWKTTGTSAAGQCTWIRKQDDNVGAAEITRGDVSQGQAVTVTLNAGEYFTTLWCSTWEYLGR